MSRLSGGWDAELLTSQRGEQVKLPLTMDRLKEFLAYYPDAGIFVWQKTSNRNGGKAGTQAGYLRDGYLVIKLDRRAYMAHRLAYFYMHGKWPSHQIDHISGDRLDNRAVNLRPATNTQNRWNVGTYKNNSSGIRGVCWKPNIKRWVARIGTLEGRKTLGTFKTKEEAAAVYADAARKYHGEFARVPPPLRSSTAS